HLNATQSALLRRGRSEYEQSIANLFAEAVSDGAFTPLDSSLATRAILGAVGEFYRWLMPEGRLGVQQITGYVRDPNLNGAATKHWVPTPRTLENPALTSDDRPIDKLVTAAARLFRARGYQNASTREIAEISGVTKGALFYHAGTKEELLVKIHDNILA